MTGAEYGIVGVCLVALASWVVKRERELTRSHEQRVELLQQQLIDYQRLTERNNALHDRTVQALEAVADVMERVADALDVLR